MGGRYIALRHTYTHKHAYTRDGERGEDATSKMRCAWGARVGEGFIGGLALLYIVSNGFA